LNLSLSDVGFAVALGLLAWGVFQLRVYVAAGAGYRAKVLCTGIFGSGRPFDRQLASQISADGYWLLRPFRVQVDYQQRSVTASLLGSLPRTAIHRDGLGATLLSSQSVATLDTSGVTHASARHAASPRDWRTRSHAPALHHIVDDAFGEPNPRRLRRTYAVIVVQDGQIIAERYAPGITAETALPGWSMTKSVLNALVGILVDEGHLALDQRELLPEWRRPDPRAEISIEDLLRMRSGLRFSEAYSNPWSDVLHMLYRSHDAGGYAAHRPLDATPGSVWQYSSGTTNILSNIVRRAVGNAHYRDWPRRVLFDPLGMTSAVLEPDGSGTFVCSSYMLATARDWARFGQLYLDNGRFADRTILPEGWVRFSTTPSPQSPQGRYGAHWWLMLNPELGGDSQAARRIAPDAFFAIGHEGQTLTVIPSKRLVVVRLGASIYIDAWNQAAFIADLQDAL
jgi:CubicO group peptidase (beta-lactamase class C family)